jgi:hypothetical protein
VNSEGILFNLFLLFHRFLSKNKKMTNRWHLLFHFSCRLVKDLQECTGDVTREIIDKTIEKLNKFLHPNHYLSLLAKRHLIVIEVKNLKGMNTNELQQRKKLCEEVTKELQGICLGAK